MYQQGNIAPSHRNYSSPYLPTLIGLGWDNGWMIPAYAREEEVNNRLEVMWNSGAFTEFSLQGMNC